MISAVIVASSYVDYFSQETNIDTISNNIFLEIIIAIDIAMMLVIMSASTASATYIN